MTASSSSSTVYPGDLRELVMQPGEALTAETAVYILCPFHDDHSRPSMRVYANGAKCFTCGKYLGRRGFSELFSDRDKSNAYLMAGLSGVHKHVERKPRVDPTLAALSAHDGLMSKAGSPEWDSLEGRGINLRMVSMYLVGHNGVAYSLPVWDETGAIVAVRYRRDDVAAPHMPNKYWGLRGQNSTLIYPRPPTENTIVLTEGEFDALLLRRYGVAAYSFTNGAMAIPPLERLHELLPVTERVVLMRDQDKAGREGTERLFAALWDATIAAEKVEWDPSDGKDLTELWQRDFALFSNLVSVLQARGI